MITHHNRGDAFWIRLDRPEKRNAINMTGWREIREGLDRGSEESRVVVITGVEDVFSAGNDIETFEQITSQDELDEFGSTVMDVFKGIEETPVPVIAAINGLAYGGGCEIVAACDLAVAVEGARFSQPEVRLGGSPTFGISRFPEFGGHKRGMELALTGEPITAETAHQWGLVNRVVSEGQLEPTVDEFVEAICEAPERAIRLTKRYSNGRRWEPDERDRYTDQTGRLLFSGNLKDGADTFLAGE